MPLSEVEEKFFKGTRRDEIEQAFDDILRQDFASASDDFFEKIKHSFTGYAPYKYLDSIKFNLYKNILFYVKSEDENKKTHLEAVAKPDFFEEFLGNEICEQESLVDLGALEQISITPKLSKKAVLRQSHLDVIEGWLKDVKKLEFQSPTDIPSSVGDGLIVKAVYLSGNEELIKLFQKYLPIPDSSIFPQDKIPGFIKKRDEEISGNVAKFALRYHEKDKEKVTIEESIEKARNIAIILQRNVRGKKRRKQEVGIFHNLNEKHHADFDGNITREIEEDDTKKLIEDANKPYQPKCEEDFSDKILEISKKISPFKTVKHLAATKNIAQILDGGLYGRKTLLSKYIPFRKAALAQIDSNNGDADVICMSAQKIDERCLKDGTIGLVFDLQKISSFGKKNPCIFFKQKDLGLWSREVMSVKIGNVDVNFKYDSCDDKAEIEMHFYQKEDLEKIANNDPVNSIFSSMQNFLMISSNFDEMHQILAMNFFRFIDATGNHSFKKNIYDELRKMNDEELLQTLQNIMQVTTKYMEFNFYGSHFIDLDSLEKIENYNDKKKEPFVLDMKEFKNILEIGNVAEFLAIKSNIAELFDSYRFVDYAINHTNNEEILKDLYESRAKIKFMPREKYLQDLGPIATAGSALASHIKEQEKKYDNNIATN